MSISGIIRIRQVRSLIEIGLCPMPYNVMFESSFFQLSPNEEYLVRLSNTLKQQKTCLWIWKLRRNREPHVNSGIPPQSYPGTHAAFVRQREKAAIELIEERIMHFNYVVHNPKFFSSHSLILAGIVMKKDEDQRIEEDSGVSVYAVVWKFPEMAEIARSSAKTVVNEVEFLDSDSLLLVEGNKVTVWNFINPNEQEIFHELQGQISHLQNIQHMSALGYRCGDHFCMRTYAGKQIGIFSSTELRKNEMFPHSFGYKVSPDGKYLLIGSAGEVGVWTVSNIFDHRIPTYVGRIKAVQFLNKDDKLEIIDDQHRHVLEIRRGAIVSQNPELIEEEKKIDEDEQKSWIDSLGKRVIPGFYSKEYLACITGLSDGMIHVGIISKFTREVLFNFSLPARPFGFSSTPTLIPTGYFTTRESHQVELWKTTWKKEESTCVSIGKWPNPFGEVFSSVIFAKSTPHFLLMSKKGGVIYHAEQPNFRREIK